MFCFFFNFFSFQRIFDVCVSSPAILINIIREMFSCCRKSKLRKSAVLPCVAGRDPSSAPPPPLLAVEKKVAETSELKGSKGAQQATAPDSGSLKSTLAEAKGSDLRKNWMFAPPVKNGDTLLIATWNVLHQSPLEHYGKHPLVVATLARGGLNEGDRAAHFVVVIQSVLRSNPALDAICLQEVSPGWLVNPFLVEEFIVFVSGTIAVLVRRSVCTEDAANAWSTSMTKLGTGHKVALQPLDLRNVTSGSYSTVLLAHTVDLGRSVTNGVVTVQFLHRGLNAIVSVSSAHLPYQSNMANASALCGSFWSSIPTETAYVVAGDFNMDTEQPLLRALYDSCPTCSAQLLQYRPSDFTARNVHTGAPTVIDHVMASGHVQSVEILPRRLQHLMPQGERDPEAWDSAGWEGTMWISDHALVISRVTFSTNIPSTLAAKGSELKGSKGAQEATAPAVPEAKDGSLAQSTIPKTVMQSEEASLHESSRLLREKFRNHGRGKWICTGTASDEATYRVALADAVAPIREKLRLFQNRGSAPPFATEGRSVPAGLTPPSRDPKAPLNEDLDAAYSVHLLEWLWTLPRVAEAAGLRYTPGLIATMAGDCEIVLGVLENELRGNPTDKKHPIQYTNRTREHLNRAVKELTDLRVAPAMAAEECTAVALYTLELLTDKKTWSEELQKEKKAVITNRDVHGYNASLYGVMNWVTRVYRTKQLMFDLDKGEGGKQVAATVVAFLPLLARIDVFLCRMPVERRRLYRGINYSLNPADYAPGCLLSWSALSSTTRDYKVAHEFGTTLFVLDVHNAATIDFLTYFPEEEECLLPTFTWIKAMGAMSPTMLRMLGSTCTYIVVQAVGDDPTTEQTIERLLDRKQNTEHLFADYMKEYVEARLHTSPPPLPAETKTTGIFTYTEQTLLPRKNGRLLLLGGGGTGKTSAGLALYCHLIMTSNPTEMPVLPAFIPMASIRGLLTSASALDEALCTSLGVEPRQMDALIQQARIVVIFDSLDECDVPAIKKLFPLLDKTSFCQSVTVIVTSRPEAVSGVNANALIEGGHGCTVQYVQPFTMKDVETYVDLVLPPAQGQTTKDNIARLKEMGVVGNLLMTPVTLRMGVEILKHELDARRTPLSDITKDCRENTKVVMDYQKGTHAYLYQMYLLSRLSACGKRQNDKETLLKGADVAKYFPSLWKVSLHMLSTGNSSLPLCVVLRYFGENGQELLKNYVPMRVESLHDPNASFSFFHKTIGEFLCAQAFWCGSTTESLEGLERPFSKEEANTLMFFHQCAMSDKRRREIVCGGHIVELLRKVKGGPVASNAMALLGISQYPMQGTDLRGLKIHDANLYDARFDGANLEGTEFSQCDMNKTTFHHCKVEGMSLMGCTFGGILGGPLKGHSDFVTSVAFSHDGKQVVSGSDDKTARILDAVIGKALTTETAFEFLLPSCTDLLPMTPQSFGDLILYVMEGDHGRRLCVTTANPKPFVLGRPPYVHPFSGLQGSVSPQCLTDHAVRYLFGCD